MSAPVIESYEGKLIPFRAGDAFVNATEMCAAFGKRPTHFLQLESTKAFIVELVNSNGGNPVIWADRGNRGSTWLHPDLALECARWLSPKFAIWCNRVIRKILSGEGAPAFQIPKTLSEALLMAATQAEQKERLLLQNTTLTADVERMQPKEEFFDCAMASRDTLLIRDAAKLLHADIPGGMGEKRLFAWMRANGWLFGDNRPYQSRVDAGYLVPKERPVPTNHGTVIKVVPRLTQRGLVALRRALLKKDTLTQSEFASLA